MLNEGIFRSPKWLRNFVDFEINTGKDIKGEQSERSKERERKKIEKEIEKKWNLKWNAMYSSYTEREKFKDFFNDFYKNRLHNYGGRVIFSSDLDKNSYGIG